MLSSRCPKGFLHCPFGSVWTFYHPDSALAIFMRLHWISTFAVTGRMRQPDFCFTVFGFLICGSMRPASTYWAPQG